MNPNNEIIHSRRRADSSVTTLWQGLFLATFATMHLLSAHTANATLLVYDSFDYTAGNTIVGNAGGTGFATTGVTSWSGNSTLDATILSAGTGTVQASSLVYSGLSTAGGSLAMAPGTGSISVYRGLSSNYSFGTYYVSFLIQKTNSGTGNMLLSLLNGSTSQVEIGQENQYNASGINGNWAIRTPSSGIATSSGIPVTNNVTMLVLKLQLTAAADTLSLYVNPTSSTEPGSANLTYTLDVGQFNAIRLSTDYTYFGASTVTGTFDELRIGTTFADVAPIPEPGSAALVAIGVAGLAWFSRRKRLA